MGKVNLNFEILQTYNPKEIVIVDTSSWEHIFEKPSIIEITLPGDTRYITHYYEKNSINVFNSNNLGLKCVTCTDTTLIDLPDGLYQFTVKGSPSTFNLDKQYLKTDGIRLKLDRLFIKALECCNIVDKAIITKLQEIDFYIKSAEASARLGDCSTAQALLTKADKLISKFSSCVSCV